MQFLTFDQFINAAAPEAFQNAIEGTRRALASTASLQELFFQYIHQYGAPANLPQLCEQEQNHYEIGDHVTASFPASALCALMGDQVFHAILNQHQSQQERAALQVMADLLFVFVESDNNPNNPNNPENPINEQITVFENNLDRLINDTPNDF